MCEFFGYRLSHLPKNSSSRRVVELVTLLVSVVHGVQSLTTESVPAFRCSNPDRELLIGGDRIGLFDEAFAAVNKALNSLSRLGARGSQLDSHLPKVKSSCREVSNVLAASGK
jgi:hypothetical protein